MLPPISRSGISDVPRNCWMSLPQALDNAGAQELATIVHQFLDEQIQANRKINDLNKELAEQNKRIAELEQQQRALTRIEQKIQQRDNPEEAGNGN